MGKKAEKRKDKKAFTPMEILLLLIFLAAFFVIMVYAIGYAAGYGFDIGSFIRDAWRSWGR